VVFARSTLSRISRERIAVVVSAANTCRYRVAHHGEALRRLGDEPATIAEPERVARDPRAG
jgi:AhpD family alkylhydroperoxidase